MICLELYLPILRREVTLKARAERIAQWKNDIRKVIKDFGNQDNYIVTTFTVLYHTHKSEMFGNTNSFSWYIIKQNSESQSLHYSRK